MLETSVTSSHSTLDLADPISPTVLQSGNDESQPTQTKKLKSAQPPKRATEIFQWLQEVRNPTTKTITGYNCAICKSARQFGLKVSGSWVDNPFQDLNKLKERAAMHNSTTLHKQAASLVNQTQPMIHVAIERLSRQNEWRDQIFLILEEKWNVLRHINHVFLLRRNYRVKYFCINSASICMSTL